MCILSTEIALGVEPFTQKVSLRAYTMPREIDGSPACNTTLLTIYFPPFKNKDT